MNNEVLPKRLLPERTSPCRAINVSFMVTSSPRLALRAKVSSSACLGASVAKWLFFLLVAVSADVSLAAQATSQEEISYQKSDVFVEFALSERPSSVHLQGLVPQSGRWVTLVSRKKPPLKLSRLRIPRGWRESELRVVARYPANPSRRKTIPSVYDRETRGVTFLAAAGSRLFSVEAKEAGKSAWNRVSTVAAPAAPASIRVALPSSLPAGVSIRVVAVSGARPSAARLSTPLSESMRRGPATFAARLEAVSSQPVFSQQADVVSSIASGAKIALPTVEESDIWKIHGDRIYFFNRLRGLQVVDATDRAKPILAGRLFMAGVGEEMYVLGSPASPATGAILLTTLPWSPSQPGGTRVNRISFTGNEPAFETSLDLPGDYVESRLVGGSLHVVTRSGSWNAVANSWVSETSVSTIDLSSEKSLVLSASQGLPFEATAVGSTGKYLWVAGASPSSAWLHRLAAFPIETDGSLLAPLESDLGGQIQDKFKVGDTSHGLAVVVQSWILPDWIQKTSVETYRAQDGEDGKLVRVAEVEVVRDESLFATRFDGDRLYAVTFQQIDPLWIIDLSDPAKPDIKGHLEVPGWSSFIQPIGDVLLAVGRDGSKVQVSMFDVSDPEKPTLAQRIDVGEGWSWSEAEWNEKAVKILPESGLILIPVVESTGASRSNKVCLVEFDAAARTLAKRGVINHAFEPRRAAAMEDDTIASLSNRELLLLNAANRDLPSVTAELTLARGIDRIVLHGGAALLIEDGEGGWSGSDRKAVLRTAPAGDLETIVTEVSLPCQEVAAAAVFGDHLVLVERSSAARWWWFRSASASAKSEDLPKISVWSLTDPVAPQLVGRVDLPFSSDGEVDLLPVAGGLVAVVSRDRGSVFHVLPMPTIMRAASDLAVSSVARIAPPFRGWGNQSLHVAIAQIEGNAPTVVGKWDLSGDQYSDVSEVYSAGDLLVFSFAAREQDASTLPEDYWSNWRTRHWLQILDLADVTAPMPWAPVQLPGELLGVSWLQRAGGTVFARSEDRVAALGFDGENASLVAEIPVTSAFCLQGASLYFATSSGVDEWTFSEETRKWSRGPGWPFSNGDGIYDLHLVDGALLAGGYNQAWVLGEDDTVTSASLPWGADLGAAIRWGETLLVPAGEYGAVLLR